MTASVNLRYGVDARKTLASIAAKSVQTCITSPPYYGLRDYGQTSQIGLNVTIDEYVASLVDVFRKVRRVLRDDGTLWLNLGDSYASGGRTYRAPDGKDSKNGRVTGSYGPTDPDGIKPKDLLGIPWRVAFALQADGWYLRQDIIWHKTNPMPESVRDRCTRAHEYLFLLSKSERYYFDSEAIREPAVGKNRHDLTGGRYKPPGQTEHTGSRNTTGKEPDGLRNRRSVWVIATQPYRGAHFAVFPPALVEPCILAGSRAGDLVLDPFSGSGTTGAVALAHGRSYLGCDLNSAYLDLALARIEATRRIIAGRAVEYNKEQE